MESFFHNRIEPEGPNRYLKTDADIRSYLKKDRKIVSTIIVAAALKVLKNQFDFSSEDLELFHKEVQKEIGNK